MNRPTIAAIETAVKNAEKMHGLYNVVTANCLPGRVYVQHNEQPNRCYIVDMRTGKERCTCEQFKRVAICKHQIHAHETLRITEGEEVAQGKIDAGVR